MGSPRRAGDPAAMPRKHRLHAPACGSHLTGRLQFGHRWFADESRDEFTAIICEAASTFRHTLLAFALMPNHFHIVVQQGDTPLGWMMQRIMQRMAARLHKRYNISGHVFGQRYSSSLCATPMYLRRAIVYTHLNPCKAEICADPSTFRWSSHAAYLRENAPWADHIDTTNGLALFAGESQNVVDMRANYAWFVNYTMERRRTGIPGDWLLPQGRHRLFIPPARMGDEYWATKYSAGPPPTSQPSHQLPIYDAAVAMLHRIDPNCSLDDVRNGGRSRSITALRRRVIEGLSALGYRTGAIARCMRVTQSMVSHVKSDMRMSAIHHNSRQAP